MSEVFKDTAGDRRADLAALRTLLIEQLADTGHVASCECNCGPARDGRVLAALSAELRKVNLELEKLPSGEAVSTLDRIAAGVPDELATRRSARGAAASGVSGS